MWRTVKLGDYLTVQNGFAFDSKLFDADGEIGLIRIRDLKEGVSTETRYAGEYDNKFIVQRGDLLIGMDGEFRCYEWKGEDALLNQRVCRLQDFDAELDKRFLLYAINDELKKIEDVTGFTTVKHLSSKTIKEIQLSLPPLAEQQRIVAKLDAAFAEIDRAIEINKERYKEVKTLIAKSQNQLFLSISTAASVMRLGDVAKFENGDRGKNYPSKKYQIEEGIPFVNAGDFSLDGEIETESMVYISEERFDLLGAGKFTIDDVLFCLRGSLGKSAINKSIEVGAIASSLVILRANKNIISSDYLFAYIRSDIVKNLIEQTAGGAAQPNLSAKVVSNYEIPVPPMEEQQRLSDKFWLFRQKGLDVLDSISQKSQRLNALKAAMLAQELNPSEAA